MIALHDAVLRLVVLKLSGELDEIDVAVVDDRIDEIVQLVLDDNGTEARHDGRMLGSGDEGVIDCEKLQVLVVEETNDRGEKRCCWHALSTLVLLRECS